MKIVIAPDSFKGSLTATEAAGKMLQAVKLVDENFKVEVKPMADGGEGTLDSLLTATTGKRVSLRCIGPLGDEMNTAYGLLDSTTAVVECASIAGLPQVPMNRRNPDITTSYGIGEAIRNGLERGCTSFVIGLGGSAVNDGGLGMLQALGMKAWDKNGQEVGMFGKDLLHVSRISLNGLDSRLKNAKIMVACDVDNPLCGKKGATYVYGPQKGATNDQLLVYDLAMNRYAELIQSATGCELKDVPGAGAAGGLGFALLVIGAKLTSGAKLIAEKMGLEGTIRDADLVLTGEGQSDEQTLYGKAPGYVGSLAQKHGVPALLISGSLGEGRDTLAKRFTGYFSIVNKPIALEESMEQAGELLFEQTKQVVGLVNAFKNELIS
ncbi:glycerate kinase [Virgibacillus kekensis]|uniref:Glycerate kinase n=1 Tax=Virgibacillus kekensis TaxID=202261 RepID=A0ABV9DIS9_9BACI